MHHQISIKVMLYAVSNSLFSVVSSSHCTLGSALHILLKMLSLVLIMTTYHFIQIAFPVAIVISDALSSIKSYDLYLDKINIFQRKENQGRQFDNI